MSDTTTWVRASVENHWGSNWMMCEFYFGKGYTIFIRRLGIIGNEIHVQSTVPLRNIVKKIMDKYNSNWWTSIHPSNIKAANLAKKTGFVICGNLPVRDISTGEITKLDIYKRANL